MRVAVGDIVWGDLIEEDAIVYPGKAPDARCVALPKKTLACALAKQADVLVQVKENQPELLAMCRLLPE